MQPVRIVKAQPVNGSVAVRAAERRKFDMMRTTYAPADCRLSTPPRRMSQSGRTATVTGQFGTLDFAVQIAIHQLKLREICTLF